MDKIVYVDDNYPIGIYLDKNHKRPLSTGKYGIIFNNISDNAWSFSKKELNLTSHSPKSGSRSKLSKKEILSVLKAERKKLGEARIIFGIDFMAVAVFNIMIMINFFRLFSYSIALLII